jgi:hypothetical protein
MNVSPSRILDLPLEKGGGQADQHDGKSGQDKNIRIDARESGIFQKPRLERLNGIDEWVDVGNLSQPDRESLDRIIGSGRKVQQSIQKANMARGTSGTFVYLRRTSAVALSARVAARSPCRRVRKDSQEWLMR